jgi:hypothetical protein
MVSQLKVNEIIKQSGSSITIGESGDTVNVPSGATLDIASGATITNSGTATGFGATNKPAFFAYASANLTCSDGASTKAPLNTAPLDTSSGFNTSTYRFTVPSGGAGTYFVNFAGKTSIVSGSNAIYYTQMQLKKNGSDIAKQILDMRNPSSAVSDISQQINLNVPFLGALADGDYLEGWVETFTNGGVPRIAGESTPVTYLLGYRIYT